VLQRVTSAREFRFKRVAPGDRVADDAFHSGAIFDMGQDILGSVHGRGHGDFAFGLYEDVYRRCVILV
jgi:hypothetical protein